MEFTSGKNKVTFESQGANLVGNLYLPEGFDVQSKYPTIVFSGPFNQVKEQMGALYGKKMAARGYVFLAFDHLGYGESEGQLRNNENAFIKMETIRNAISYLRTLPFADREKFYGIGGCASGGYVPLVAVTDKRMKAIATISGMMDNMSMLRGLDKATAIGMFTAANEARQKQYETGEVNYYDVLGYEGIDPETLPEGARREGYDYYMTERAGAATYPNYSNRSPMTINEITVMTNATAYAPYLYTPYLGIYGEKAMADTGPLTIAYFNACSEPKELVEIKGASHVDLYDVEAFVDESCDHMDAFFKKY